MIDQKFAPYVGLPYRDKGRGPDAWDCWGGIRMVFAEVFGLELPDYADAYSTANDLCSVSEAITRGLADGWVKCERAQEGDLLSLKIAGRPWHCGIMVNSGQFLHWPPPGRDGREKLSCVERIDTLEWNRRILGFYRRP